MQKQNDGALDEEQEGDEEAAETIEQQIQNDMMQMEGSQAKDE
jgi:hypothetical protein